MATPNSNPDKWVDEYADYLFNYAIGRVNNKTGTSLDKLRFRLKTFPSKLGPARIIS